MGNSEIATKAFIESAIQDFNSERVSPISVKASELSSDVYNLQTRTSSLESQVSTLNHKHRDAICLWSGSLSSGSCQFEYNTKYKFYIVQGAVASDTAYVSVVIPRSLIEASYKRWQIIDNDYFISFNLTYSGNAVTLEWAGSSGMGGKIRNVFGVE